MKCCDEIVNLGCFDPCNPIDTGLMAVQDGLHSVNVYFGESVCKFLVNVATGEPILIPQGLNECFTHVFNITNPDGTAFEVDGVECFSVTTQPVKIIA